jgi:hypothetical protein
MDRGLCEIKQPMKNLRFTVFFESPYFIPLPNKEKG